MGRIFPIIMLLAYVGLNATAAQLSKYQIPTPAQSAAVLQMQNMINYRDAVINYIAANPGFTGSIAIADLASYLPQGIQVASLPVVGNVISSIAGGRQVVIYGSGVIQGAVFATQSNAVDASLGSQTVNGWVSDVNPSFPITVNTPQLAGRNVMWVFNTN